MLGVEQAASSSSSAQAPSWSGPTQTPRLGSQRLPTGQIRSPQVVVLGSRQAASAQTPSRPVTMATPLTEAMIQPLEADGDRGLERGVDALDRCRRALVVGDHEGADQGDPPDEL